MGPADLSSEPQLRRFLHWTLRCVRPAWWSRPWSWLWGVACGGEGGAIRWCAWFGRRGLPAALQFVLMFVVLCARLFFRCRGLQRKNTRFTLMLLILAPSSGGLLCYSVLHSLSLHKLVQLTDKCYLEKWVRGKSGSECVEELTCPVHNLSALLAFTAELFFLTILEEKEQGFFFFCSGWYSGTFLISITINLRHMMIRDKIHSGGRDGKSPPNYSSKSQTVGRVHWNWN